MNPSASGSSPSFAFIVKMNIIATWYKIIKLLKCHSASHQLLALSFFTEFPRFDLEGLHFLQKYCAFIYSCLILLNPGSILLLHFYWRPSSSMPCTFDIRTFQVLLLLFFWRFFLPFWWWRYIVSPWGMAISGELGWSFAHNKGDRLWNFYFFGRFRGEILAGR